MTEPFRGILYGVDTLPGYERPKPKVSEDVAHWVAMNKDDGSLLILGGAGTGQWKQIPYPDEED